MDEKKLRQMKRYRIYRYGLFDHIFDVQVKSGMDGYSLRGLRRM